MLVRVSPMIRYRRAHLPVKMSYLYPHQAQSNTHQARKTHSNNHHTNLHLVQPLHHHHRHIRDVDPLQDLLVATNTYVIAINIMMTKTARQLSANYIKIFYTKLSALITTTTQ